MFKTLVESKKIGSLVFLTLKDPQTLNALSADLIGSLNYHLDIAEADLGCRVIIITGSGKAFAAGAHLGEIKDFNAQEASQRDFIAPWEHILTITKPIIAAINGFALGGGWELAMMCDIRIASTTASFGHPEIQLGTMPGAGGTQRLTHAIGCSRAMELCLTGKRISATEALHYGIVNKVIEPEDLISTAQNMGEDISQFSQPVVKDIKRMIRSVEGQALERGLKEEKKAFYRTFDRFDQKEGMHAFLEKRSPLFKDQ